MSSIAIKVDKLGKAYRIGLKEQQHETMLGTMAAWIKAPLRNFRDLRNLGRFEDAKPDSSFQPSAHAKRLPIICSNLSPPPSDIIWALKDVSFDVKDGETVGIIGRNGAGKSTLLKILSRITEPTSGRAEIRGRVASLLEVGTGFHPDLTGRENTYLNGTILGMRKREIDARFDEIVDFSGVEQFIDTPVKRYSSGMRVRLAFSVAAHLEPEILIIDEVLAVGDVGFQKKCLWKMGDVAKQGRTVLFVSHNMAAVRNLCVRGVWLRDGMIAKIGEIGEVIQACLADQVKPVGLLQKHKTVDDPVFRLEDLKIRQDQEDTATMFTNRPTRVEVFFTLKKDIAGLRLGFDLCTPQGEVIWRSFVDDTKSALNGAWRPGTYKSVCIIPGDLLSAQTYELVFLAGIHQVRWITKNDVRLTLSYQNIDGVNSHYSDTSRPGILMPLLEWRTVREGHIHAEE
jgi:lipopolysaccharide transport system ATP-binding protein